MDTLGRYQLIRKIAGGGMADIYLAKLVGAAGFEKEIVVKTIRPQWSQHADFIAMLVDEAKIAVRLTHPNIVQVYELAREGETYFIVMEYVPGWDARRLLQAAMAKKSKVPLEAALFIVMEILEGLAYAHERKDAKGVSLKIVHRDISPQNILLSSEGAVKITDFGIAKAASKSHETATGVLKGKFAYMSPEQANPASHDRGAVDGRSDLFSTAIVLFELLTGERLFYRGSDAATLDSVRRAEFAPSPQAMKNIPEALYEILAKALSASPNERYWSAREFRKALADFAGSAGLGVRREQLVEVLEKLFSEETPEGEPTVVASSEATRTAVHAEDRSQTLVERSDDWDRTSLLLEDTEKAETLPPPSRSGRTIASAIVGFVALYAIVCGVVWFKSGKPPFPPPKFEAETVAAATVLPAPAEALPEKLPQNSSSDLEQSPVVALTAAKEKPTAKGYLSVQAIPWGTVAIDGAGKRETPLHRLPLTAGHHTVRVRYEPDGKAAASAVTVVEGKEIVCVANFRSGKELKCGK